MKRRPPKRTDKLTVRLDPDLHKEAADYAKKHGVSVASIFRWLMRKWLRRKEPLPPEALDEMRRAEGGGRPKKDDNDDDG